MNNCQQQLEQYAAMVETALPDYLPGGAISNQVEKAMAYSLCGGGKRIRGVMVLAFYRLFSQTVEEALPFAAALEMVHAYSLIHDDLPCMDDDNLRRGQPACHIAFGEATALLAGDGLLTLAFETMAAPQCLEAFGPGTVARAVQVLAKAAGTRGMIGGQEMDLDNEGRQVSAERLRETDGKKTGALFGACAEIGCILGGAGEGERKAALEYTSQVGLVFQIVDDILDRSGDEKALGKPLHSDEAQNKATYATLYGVQRCRELVEELNNSAKAALEKTGLDTGFLCGLADYLARRHY